MEFIDGNIWMVREDRLYVLMDTDEIFPLKKHDKQFTGILALHS